MTGARRLRAARHDDGVLGIWSVLADPVVVEVAATSGAGYVCLDLQHGFAGPEQLPSLVRAARRGDAACLVRPAWNRPEAIMRALDAGADGVVVPMVDTAQEALAAVEACHYAPSGNRSWGPLWADVDGVPPQAPTDDEVFCAVMIETALGLANLEQILAVPGLDGIYVGPNDLALSVGLGRVRLEDSDQLQAIVERIAADAADAGVTMGLHCASPATARSWLARGVGMATTVTDSTVLAAGLRAAVTAA